MEIEHVKHKIMEGRPGFPLQYGPQRADHQPGIPLFPQEATRDLAVSFLLTAILFFLSAYVTPILGPARSPGLGELIVPDWYVLFSYGLLKVAAIFPVFTLGEGTPLETNFNAAFWGVLLTSIPLVFLFILPFIDRGREARPAKAPVRSAFGLAFLIVWMFTASLYSIREVVAERWRTADVDPREGCQCFSLIPDGTMKLFFVIPPVLVGVATYVGLRRLGYQPMRTWLVPTVTIPAVIVAAQSLGILFISGWLSPYVEPYRLWVTLMLIVLSATAAAAALAVIALPESRARKVVTWTGLLGSASFVGLYLYMEATDPIGTNWVLFALFPEMNSLILLPMFGVLTAWLGTRRPYSTYEYLLNECYQCGKCHTVCPVTKVEDDALGGLNLVYNTFKKQHDGVPLWTCLACDACSAVCPLDIQYSDYILEERAKVHARMAADGGGRR